MEPESAGILPAGPGRPEKLHDRPHLDRAALRLGQLRHDPHSFVQIPGLDQKNAGKRRLCPDLLVGTSIGAVNAACLALWGVNMEGVAALERVYQGMAEGQLMDTPGRLVWHALSGRPDYTSQRMRDYLVDAGITPGLLFAEIQNVRLGLIGAEMGSGQLLVYGMDPGQSVLEGVLVSCSVPPWFEPIENDDQLIVDGGALSLLPIEPALNMGATEIITLNLSGSPSPTRLPRKLNQVNKAVASFVQHETDLELALAEAKGVPVHDMQLLSNPPIQMWDFSTYRDLIATGYETATRCIADW